MINTPIDELDLINMNSKFLNKEERELQKKLKKQDRLDTKNDLIDMKTPKTTYAHENFSYDFSFAHVSKMVEMFRDSIVYNISEDGTYLMDDNGNIVLCEDDIIYIDHAFEDPYIVRIALDDVNFDDTVNILEFTVEQTNVLFETDSDEAKELNRRMLENEEAAAKERAAKFNEANAINFNWFKGFGTDFAPQNTTAYTRKVISHKKTFANIILDID